MVLSNKAYPEEYSKFKESVLRGEIPVSRTISLEMNRIDFLIQSPDYYYDDQAIQGFIRFCENEMTLTDGSDVTLYHHSDYGPNVPLRGFTNPRIKYLTLSVNDGKLRRDSNDLSINNT